MVMNDDEERTVKKGENIKTVWLMTCIECLEYLRLACRAYQLLSRIVWTLLILIML